MASLDTSLSLSLGLGGQGHKPRGQQCGRQGPDRVPAVGVDGLSPEAPICPRGSHPHPHPHSALPYSPAAPLCQGCRGALGGQGHPAGEVEKIAVRGQPFQPLPRAAGPRPTGPARGRWGPPRPLFLRFPAIPTPPPGWGGPSAAHTQSGHTRHAGGHPASPQPVGEEGQTLSTGRTSGGHCELRPTFSGHLWGPPRLAGLGVCPESCPSPGSGRPSPLGRCAQEPLSQGTASMPLTCPPPCRSPSHPSKCPPSSCHPGAGSPPPPKHLLAVFADFSLLSFVAGGTLKASGGGRVTA